MDDGLSASGGDSAIRAKRRSEIEPRKTPEQSEGDLPNDVRTNYITSEAKENVLLAQLLLIKRNSVETPHSIDKS